MGLTYEDCLGLSDLTDDEVKAIEAHEHVPAIAALELGSYLLHAPNGERRIRRVIVDDIRKARETGNTKRAAELRLVLRHFVETHPEA